MAQPSAVRLAEGFYRIPLAPLSLLNCFALLEADGSVTLVDSGLRSAPPRVVAALASIGRHPRDVQRIVLTHAHGDHAAGAAGMVERSSAASVEAHADDAAALREGRVPPRTGASTVGRLLDRVAARFPPVAVGRELRDGDVLDVAGGLRVVHTPGHTPGHVSLLHEPSRVLVTGDVVGNLRGVRWSPAWLCTDPRLNQRSAEVLGELDYDVAAFTHGPEVRERARALVRQFLHEAPRLR